MSLSSGILKDQKDTQQMLSSLPTEPEHVESCVDWEKHALAYRFTSNVAEYVIERDDKFWTVNKIERDNNDTKILFAAGSGNPTKIDYFGTRSDKELCRYALKETALEALKHWISREKLTVWNKP